MNSNLAYQLFVQCIFQSIVEYLETSELCPSSVNDNRTDAFPLNLSDYQSSKITYSYMFSRITSNNSSINSNLSSYKLLLENVAHFIERMVDKIWEIGYRQPKQISEFIIKVINQAKKRSISSTFMDSLFHSLNRTILLELSRKIDSIGSKNNTNS